MGNLLTAISNFHPSKCSEGEPATNSSGASDVSRNKVAGSSVKLTRDLILTTMSRVEIHDSFRAGQRRGNRDIEKDLSTFYVASSNHP